MRRYCYEGTICSSKSGLSDLYQQQKPRKERKKVCKNQEKNEKKYAKIKKRTKKSMQKSRKNEKKYAKIKKRTKKSMQKSRKERKKVYIKGKNWVLRTLLISKAAVGARKIGDKIS